MASNEVLLTLDNMPDEISSYGQSQQAGNGYLQSGLYWAQPVALGSHKKQTNKKILEKMIKIQNTKFSTVSPVYISYNK